MFKPITTPKNAGDATSANNSSDVAKRPYVENPKRMHANISQGVWLTIIKNREKD
jgi:hypothetical protein